jgi:hypothetical protein
VPSQDATAQYWIDLPVVGLVPVVALPPIKKSRNLSLVLSIAADDRPANKLVSLARDAEVIVKSNAEP